MDMSTFGFDPRVWVCVFVLANPRLCWRGDGFSRSHRECALVVVVGWVGGGGEGGEGKRNRGFGFLTHFRRISMDSRRVKRLKGREREKDEGEALLTWAWTD